MENAVHRSKRWQEWTQHDWDLLDLAIQCVVPQAGAVQLEHAVWMQNMETCNTMINDDYFEESQECAGVDRSVSKDLLFTQGMIKLFSGSRAEQLSMDAGSGYNEPDLDLMLIIKNIDAPGGLCELEVINDEADAAFCKVKVDRSRLNLAIHPFLYKSDGGEYLNAGRFREKSMEIVAQNRNVHKKWDAGETHGPACRTSVTGYGDLDVIVCIASSRPFDDMANFYKRGTFGSVQWREVVPLKFLRALNGILVPICPRGSEGREQQLTFRKSFSTQEVIMISQLPHWCRQAAVVFKHTVLRKLKSISNSVGDAPTICSYHLKTIFLWAVEFMSVELWEMASPARLLVDLFDRLASALEIGEISSYWVPTSNLLRSNRADYLTECCNIVNVARDNIIASVLESPEKPCITFSGLSTEIVKNVYFRAGHDICPRGEVLKRLRHLVQASTWRLIVNLLHGSSGSPQCLQQAGDMVCGLENLWKRISDEDVNENHGFDMASYIVTNLLQEKDSSDVFRFPLILRGLACIRGAVDKAFPSMAAGVAVVAAVLHAELAIRHKMDEKPCPGIPRANVHHTLRDSEWIHQLLGYARHYIGHGKMLRLLAIDQRRFDNCPRFSKMMAVHTEDLTELYQQDDECANESPRPEATGCEHCRFNPPKVSQLIKFPGFAYLSHREESFMDWPPELLSRKEQLITSGYFYAGAVPGENGPPDDSVICFSCGCSKSSSGDKKGPNARKRKGCPLGKLRRRDAWTEIPSGRLRGQRTYQLPNILS